MAPQPPRGKGQADGLGTVTMGPLLPLLGCPRPKGARGSRETLQEDHHRPPRKGCWAGVMAGGVEVVACWQREGCTECRQDVFREAGTSKAHSLCPFLCSPCCGARHGARGEDPSRPRGAHLEGFRGAVQAGEQEGPQPPRDLGRHHGGVRGAPCRPCAEWPEEP